MTETTAPPPEAGGGPAKTLTVRGAAVLGIGSMIGAGIFALLGEAGTVAGAAVWLSFLIGGGVAMLIGYVCARMGMKFPSSGGLITYLVQGFGRGRLTGTASWLGYIAAIVIVTSMIAVSFGGYATALFVGENAAPGWDNLFITLMLLAVVGINLVGTKFVARAQTLIVSGVLAAFAVFICVTIANLNPDLLAFSGYPSAAKIVSSVALTFFAYLGFNVITFAAGDLRNPARELPRALFAALTITAVVYVLIAIGVFGTLTVPQVIKYGETAIAEAARPTLGDAGFTVMAVVALLSTFGATNATMYAASNLCDGLADEGLFPAFLGSRSRFGKHAGLLITAAVVLVVANAVDLSAIASVGSAVALVIFLLIVLAGWRLRRVTASNPVLIVAAFVVTATVLGFFIVDTLRNDPATFVAIVAITVLAVILDALVKRSHQAPAAPLSTQPTP